MFVCILFIEKYRQIIFIKKSLKRQKQLVRILSSQVHKDKTYLYFEKMSERKFFKSFVRKTTILTQTLRQPSKPMVIHFKKLFIFYYKIILLMDMFWNVHIVTLSLLYKHKNIFVITSKIEKKNILKYMILISGYIR